MTPLESNEAELDGNCEAGLFFEYPLITTRKHIGNEISALNGSLADSEKDLDDSTVLTLVSTPSLDGNFWFANPCTAVTDSFASCSCYTILPQTESNVQTCSGCGCDLNKAEGYTRETEILQSKLFTARNDIDGLGARNMGQKVDFGIVINDEAQLYCYECAQINQERANHARIIKIVMGELLMHFDGIEASQESEESKKEESDSVDGERNRKGKRLRIAAMKSTFSSFKNSILHRQPMEREALSIEPEETEESNESSIEKNDVQMIYSSATEAEALEDSPDEKHDIQMIYVSPTSLHYRFDECTNARETAGVTSKNKNKKNRSAIIQRAKSAYSKCKQWINGSNEQIRQGDCTRVRAVAVAW